MLYSTSSAVSSTMSLDSSKVSNQPYTWCVCNYLIYLYLAFVRVHFDFIDALILLIDCSIRVVEQFAILLLTL